MSLAINPLENRWPIKSCVQGEPPLINADCQGASLMYFSFKGSVSTVLGRGSEREQSVWFLRFDKDAVYFLVPRPPEWY